MENSFNLEKYLNQGMELLIKGAIKATLKNPKESSFLVKYMLHAKRSGNKRHNSEIEGQHIPSFLIASITGKCNLKCSGCYDKALDNCGKKNEMTSEKWHKIFSEADDLGISAILLAGGEPLMRIDVIREASNFQSMLFPIFTNGTILNEDYIEMFDKYRNLVPIISIEGNEEETDARRGSGIYKNSTLLMQKLQNKNILFGVSITVTQENIELVTSNEFIDDLLKKGCKAVIYVEYVPVSNHNLALNEKDRIKLSKKVNDLRNDHNMIIISFPGDEKEAGGCLAAGRGFFHIDALGSAEPCPFSPYSDTSLQNVSLREALKSPLFTSLRDTGLLQREHIGGCTLFENSNLVSNLVNK